MRNHTVIAPRSAGKVREEARCSTGNSATRGRRSHWSGSAACASRMSTTTTPVSRWSWAARLGISYFDTAPGYFGVKGEEVLGEGLRELKRGVTFFCSTKTFKSAEKQIRKEIAKQRKRLNVDVIDFYHVWCVLTLESWEQRKTHGIIQTLESSRRKGSFGTSASRAICTGDEIRSLLDDEVFEGVLFGFSAYNFPLRGPALEAARNLGCAVMNPLGGGLIPQNPKAFEYIKTREDQPDRGSGAALVCARADQHGSRHGFGELPEIRQAAQAVEDITIERVFAAESKSSRPDLPGLSRISAPDAATATPCPEGVPIPKFMDAYNHKMLFGSDEALLRRLRKHWSLPQVGTIMCSQFDDSIIIGGIMAIVGMMEVTGVLRFVTMISHYLARGLWAVYN